VGDARTVTDLATTRVRRRFPARTIAALVVASVLLLTGGAPARADPAARADDGDLAVERWVWPLPGFRVVRQFEAPAHDYGAGHRGIDLRGDAAAEVRAPAAGIIAFAGQVAGRGVVTIDHGAGLVTTLEPIESELVPGIAVDRGAPVGTISLGGHTEGGAVHFGVRLNGEYVNPLLLLGGVPRAVLLPCC
jgi:murein DD-endopeptidase MepM/ murein hydrolase activator NlpD